MALPVIVKQYGKHRQSTSGAELRDNLDVQ